MFACPRARPLYCIYSVMYAIAEAASITADTRYLIKRCCVNYRPDIRQIGVLLVASISECIEGNPSAAIFFARYRGSKRITNYN